MSTFIPRAQVLDVPLPLLITVCFFQMERTEMNFSKEKMKRGADERK